ncbi:replicative DNA helicase [Thermophilibacter immobilis]|jgi:replicative DNA helicase|uniref:Replicative DNA helicase n=1 Tax=Thermophilibacter immobilis TaxID=2779519 RepID=A0A7S7RVN7_9ACTN|nr:replicative DNA helicase [Thermophilibacter immobilis]QOY61504.1 replicative DNA helicase [Thermophilibacter immobilis]
MTSSVDAVMPQDPEAESSVLSAMMISAEALQECLIVLEPDDFYFPSNRTVFMAMREMFEKNAPIDTISLADHLKSTGELERVGGRSFLLGLGNNSLALVGWRRHLEMLHRDTTLRKMINASAQITALAYDAPEDTKEVVDRAEKMLLDVTNRDVHKNEQSLEEIMGELYEELGDLASNNDQPLGVLTGFPRIDECLLGLRPGQMVVIGARPGVGKTSFALNLATNAAVAGASVALFSLEMSKVEIAQRLLAAWSRVGLQEIRSARIRNEQWPQILEATNDLSQLDIMIDDTPGTTVTEIRAKARRILRGKERGIVIVDYLQLISAPSGVRRADSRATEVSEMSRGIKIMAKDLGVPVVALSQLNRTVENRTGKRPQLSDLRESGSIEQDADIVALLDRSMNEDEAAREDRPDMNETTFIIAKNRSGALADVPLTFLPGSTKFVEVDSFHD